MKSSSSFHEDARKVFEANRFIEKEKLPTGWKERFIVIDNEGPSLEKTKKSILSRPEEPSMDSPATKKDIEEVKELLKELKALIEQLSKDLHIYISQDNKPIQTPSSKS